MAGPQILVVEDDQDTRETLAMILRESLGAEVDTAADGHEGQQRLRSNRAYQLILTDERMPRMRGSELIRWVREHRPDVHRAMMSAYPDGAALARAAGSEVFLSKPLDLDMTVDAVKALLDSPSIQP